MADRDTTVTITNLSYEASKISYLNSAKKVYDDDSFLVAKPDVEQSYKAKYSAITSYLLTGLENAPAGFTPQGQWDFPNVASMVYISTDNITLSTDVPNLRYVEENLLTALTALSAQLYGDDPIWLPSYVGQVILGDNLATLAAVRKIYGADTNWIKIEGRFLLGTWANVTNTITDYGNTKAGTVSINRSKTLGGQSKVKLDGLPKHTHAFAGANYGKAPFSKDVSFKLTGTAIEKTYYSFDGGKGPHNEGGFMHRQHKRYFAAYGNQTDIREYNKTIEKNFTFKFAGEIGDNSADANKWINAPHENIPPFECTYIWERVS